MHLCTCQNPVRIVRKGEVRLVPCGKCEHCRYIKSVGQNIRFAREMAYYKFGLFVTLTYSDSFLPFMKYDSDNRIFYRPDSDEAFSFDDFDSGLYWSFPYVSESAQTLIDSQTSRYGAVPCLRKSDVQRFLKRLRITLNRKLRHHVEIYYAFCGEYGPTTFRPHYHGILLFNDEECAQRIAEILRKTWYAGSVVSRFTKSDEKPDYITRYINSINSLPSIYRPKEVCPFLVISKSHPCGFGSIDQTEIQRIFNERSPEISIEDPKTKELNTFPLPPVLENQLFPRFSGYSCLSSRTRVRLFELAATFDHLKDFLCCASVCSIDSYKALCSNFNIDFHYAKNGFQVHSFDLSSAYGFKQHETSISKNFIFDSSLKEYFYLMHKDVALPLALYEKSCCCALKSLYYASKRIIRNMHRFCVDSISEYVVIIDEYLSNREYYRLIQHLDFEKEIMLHEPKAFKYIDSLSHDSGVYLTNDWKSFDSDVNNNISNDKMKKKKHEFLRLHPEYNIDIPTDYGHL